jgi:hypothetical protein
MSQSLNDEQIDADDVHFSIEGDMAGLPAWTEIEDGRFMPRRVRGSCQGRALG